MNTEYKNKLAKDIIESLEFSIDNPIGELKVKMYLKAKLKEFQQDINKSMLTDDIDAMFEVLCRFPYKGISIEDFCTGVIYKDKLIDAKQHFLEIKTIGKTRILELCDEIRNLQKQLNEESDQMYSDSEYLELLEARKCFKKPSNSKKLIETEIYKKEKSYIAKYNKKKEFLDILSVACVGMKYSEMNADDIKSFESKITKIATSLRENNSTSNM